MAFEVFSMGGQAGSGNPAVAKSNWLKIKITQQQGHLSRRIASGAGRPDPGFARVPAASSAARAPI
jgi:hypothetical protein